MTNPAGLGRGFYGLGGLSSLDPKPAPCEVFQARRYLAVVLRELELFRCRAMRNTTNPLPNIHNLHANDVTIHVIV